MNFSSSESLRFFNLFMGLIYAVDRFFFSFFSVIFIISVNNKNSFSVFLWLYGFLVLFVVETLLFSSLLNFFVFYFIFMYTFLCRLNFWESFIRVFVSLKKKFFTPLEINILRGPSNFTFQRFYSSDF